MRTALFFTYLLAPTVHLLATPVDFTREVEPLLATRCVACHGPGRSAGGVALHSREAALRGGSSGSHTIVPGQPEQSELIRRLVTDDHDELMPRGGPLAPKEIAVIKQWIAEGARWQERS